MSFDPSQIINPGIYESNKKYQQQLARFTEAVHRAIFLSDKEKRHWRALGALLNLKQLKSAEKLIIDEDLKLLKTRYALDKIKNKTKSPK